MKELNSNEIKDFILQNVSEHPNDIVKLTVQKFNLSRQNILQHINRLISDNILESQGRTRAISYQLKMLASKSFVVEISPDLHEDLVWREKISPLLKNVPKNIFDICQYGFTEILNNAIDHSESDNALISIEINTVEINISIRDGGIGIFKKIQRDFNLPEERDAILELTKGKVTSDRQRHTGEGIFFTSRIFDEFSIHSGAFLFSHSKETEWNIKKQYPLAGTRVDMKIQTNSKQILREIFNQYTSENDLTFSKTQIIIKLAQYENENLISRSQAKRILERGEQFKEIVFDFQGIDLIGQGFADEIFRVFKNRYPQIKISYIHTNEDVERMIAHVSN